MTTEKRAQVKIDLRERVGNKTKLDFHCNPISDRFDVTIREGGGTEQNKLHCWTATEFAEHLRHWLIAQKQDSTKKF